MSRIEEGLAYLEHYGVKGMKWGVRKDSSGGGRGKNKVVGNEMGRDITKGDVKWKRKAASTKNYVAMHNEVGAAMNRQLPALNSKYNGKDLGFDRSTGQYKSADGKKYLKEYESMASKEATKAAQKVFGESPSGNWKVDASYSLESGITVHIKPTEVKHGELEVTDDGLVMEIKVAVGSNGLFQPISSLKHDDIEGEAYLEHYGVKGMKWGVRRSDAQLASARKQRKAEAKANKAGNKTEKQRRKKAVETRRVVDEKELDDLIRRLDKEKKLKSLVSEDAPASKAAVSKMLSDTGSQVAKQVLAGVAVALVAQAIGNKLGDTTPTYNKDGDVIDPGRVTTTAKELVKSVKLGGKFKDK